MPKRHIYKKRIICEKVGHNEFMWDVINNLGWSDKPKYDKQSKIIGAKLSRLFSIEYIEEVRAFAIRKRKELAQRLDEYSISTNGNLYYYGIGDDGFWDLTAHITGLGEREFNKVMNDPELAKERADQRNFIENFEYCFGDAIRTLENRMNGRQ